MWRHALLLIGLFSTTSLFPETNDYTFFDDPDVSNIDIEPPCPPPSECPPKPPTRCASCAKGCISCETPEVFQSSRPIVCEGSRVWAAADFLLFYVRQEGAAFAGQKGINSQNDPITSQGTIRHADYSVNPGFRLGFGIKMDHDQWDLLLQYTWLHADGNKNKAKMETQVGSTLFPTWDVGLQTPPNARLLHATGRYELHYNAFDLILSRSFYVSHKLMLSPNFAFRGTWEDQDTHISYRNDQSGTLTLYKMSMNQDYWGIGPRAGLNMAWHFTPQFSLTGKVALSELWSFFEVARRDDIKQNFDDPHEQFDRFINVRNKFHTVRPSMELFLGLRYEGWFDRNQYHGTIELGYEEQIFWNHNQAYRVVGPTSHGDLIFQGLTFSMNFSW